MANFVSTTTSNYGDPLKALSIKALEQRLKDQQAQMAQQSPDAAMMGTIPGGIGHVLGVVGDRMNQSRTESAAAAQKDELAKLIAGDPNGENPQTQARMAVLAPDMYKDIVQHIADRRKQQSEQAHATSLATGQQSFQRDEKKLDRDQAAQLAEEQRKLTASEGGATRQSQRDLATQAQRASADLAKAERDVKVAEAALDRAQKGGLQTEIIAAQKALEEQKAGHAVALANVNNASAERRTDSTNRTTLEAGAAGNKSAESIAFAKNAMPQSQAGQIGYDAKQGHLSANDASASMRKLTAPSMDDLTKGVGLSGDYARVSQSVNNLNEALSILQNGGINDGFWGSAQTKAAQVANGKWGTDLDAAQRTTRFNQLMSTESITQMAETLKGQTTNFEMDKFEKINNDPNTKPEQRIAALQALVAAANVGKMTRATALKAAGLDTETIDKTIAKGASKPSEPPPAGDTGGGATSQDAQALEWATANPNDPRAAAIRSRLGK